MKERIVVIMPAYNAVRALEHIYHIIMTRYEKASSVNCYRSVILWLCDIVDVGQVYHPQVRGRGATVQQTIARCHQLLSPDRTAS
jgi:hypothetical protein